MCDTLIKQLVTQKEREETTELFELFENLKIKIITSAMIPSDEVHFRNTEGKLLGKIVNIKTGEEDS